MTIEIVTKQDFEKARHDFQKGLDDLEKRLRKDINEGFNTKQDFQKGLDDLEKRLNASFEKKMRHILTEELPIILSQKFVTKDALREACT